MTERAADDSAEREIPPLDGLIRSDNHYTREQHQTILARTAAYPGLEKALTEGDDAYAEFLERVRSGELSRSSGTPGPADR